jgi:hypothetical protein
MTEYNYTRLEAMSNIRTLRDLENDRPNTQTFPNAWGGGRTLSGTDNYAGTYVADIQPQPQVQYDNPDQFWSPNIEGRVEWYHLFMLSCCPCFVGNPCSPARKNDYKRMLMSFIFWIILLQVSFCIFFGEKI